LNADNIGVGLVHPIEETLACSRADAIKIGRDYFHHGFKGMGTNLSCCMPDDAERGLEKSKDSSRLLCGDGYFVCQK
jgi:hypothetical protein